MYWRLFLANETVTQSPPHSENERHWSGNDFQIRILGNWCSDWLQTHIHPIFAAFTGKNYSNMLPAASWEWASTERQRFSASHPGLIMFWLVGDTHLSDIGSLYCEKLQWRAPGHITRMIVSGASTIVCFASWLIYVPIGCRHPFIKYWQPLLAKTAVTCSLPHPENEHQWSVNSFSCCQFGIQCIALIFTFIAESLTALIGNITIY